MIHRLPALPRTIQRDLARLDVLRERLHVGTRQPLRWMGGLRRLVMARAVDSSTSIEGYRVPLEDAAALISREVVPNADETSRLAVACYGHAMDHVSAMGEDPGFEWSTRVILDLHFEVCHFQPEVRPGRWRRGPVSVTHRDGSIAYRAPDAEEVPGLMEEVIGWLSGAEAEAAHPIVRAAMAHLHVVSVHPFQDGNGRLARIVQSLVLARDGLVAPEFASIEEYLGERTDAYYTALQGAQGPRYNPSRDATGWVRFCVAAHLEQAERRLREIEAAAARWESCEALVASLGWPDRFVIALERALTGYLDRAGYSAEAGVSPITASLDFRRLLDAGLVVQEGRGRSTRYRASLGLRRRIATGNQVGPAG
ncbi:MAG TPA: Fic family protein [Candidatus Dormibacteraeota bacterium]|jgi:Fic family protein